MLHSECELKSVALITVCHIQLIESTCHYDLGSAFKRNYFITLSIFSINVIKSSINSMHSEYSESYEDDFEKQSTGKINDSSYSLHTSSPIPNTTMEAYKNTSNNSDISSRINELANEKKNLMNEISIMESKLIMMNKGQSQTSPNKKYKKIDKILSKGLIDEYMHVKKSYDKFFNVDYLVELNKRIKNKEIKLKQKEDDIQSLRVNLLNISKDIIKTVNTKSNELQRIEVSQMHVKLATLMEKCTGLQQIIEKNDKEHLMGLEKELEYNIKINKLEEILGYYYNNKNKDQLSPEAYRNMRYKRLNQMLDCSMNKSVNSGNRYYDKIKILQKELNTTNNEILVNEKALDDIMKKRENLSNEFTRLYSVFKPNDISKNSHIGNKNEIIKKEISFTEGKSLSVNKLIHSQSKSPSAVRDQVKIHQKLYGKRNT